MAVWEQIVSSRCKSQDVFYTVISGSMRGRDRQRDLGSREYQENSSAWRLAHLTCAFVCLKRKRSPNGRQQGSCGCDKRDTWRAPQCFDSAYVVCKKDNVIVTSGEHSDAKDILM